MREFIYPYNFVRLREAPQRDGNYLSHSTFSSIVDGKETLVSGKLECSLEVKTPLFIRESVTMEEATNHKRGMWDFYHIGNEYVIPPTSIKGMIRSVTETVTNSCMSQLEKRYGKVVLKDFAHSPCEKLDNLCFCCKMFGIVSEGRDRDALAGRVNLTFGRPDGELDMFWLKDSERAYSATPKPDKAEKLYFKAKTPKGRKFYWHHNGWKDLMIEVKDEEIKSDKFIISEEDIKNGRGAYHFIKAGKFKFEVDYYNLKELELYCLIYALELGADMWHKLGKGKSLGCGSVKITIDNQKVINRHDRYSKGILEKAVKYRDNFNVFKKAVIDKMSQTLSKKYPDFKDLLCIMKSNTNKGLIIKGKEYPVCYPTIDTGKNWYKLGTLPSIEEIKNGTVSTLDSPYWVKVK